jgi:hypothetical protein
MANTLTFQVDPPPLLMNVQLNDNGGNWQYVGANVVDSNGRSAQLIAMKRENSIAGVTFSASMLTATVLYPPEKAGDVAPNLTIQGVHDLTSNNETGSVSSASKELAEYIGCQFFFDFAKALLTIYARG